MDLLMQLQYITTAEGVQEVIAAISEQAQLSSDFQVRERVGGDREGGREGWMDEDRRMDGGRERGGRVDTGRREVTRRREKINWGQLLGVEKIYKDGKTERGEG